ncbi:MAG: hypothetical protein ACREP7_08400 [Lysobacter sp.]
MQYLLADFAIDALPVFVSAFAGQDGVQALNKFWTAVGERRSSKCR